MNIEMIFLFFCTALAGQVASTRQTSCAPCERQADEGIRADLIVSPQRMHMSCSSKWNPHTCKFLSSLRYSDLFSGGFI